MVFPDNYLPGADDNGAISASRVADHSIPSSTDMDPEVSVVMPCLNEARTVGACIECALQTMQTNNLRGEVIIADNDSIDGSREIAQSAGARVVRVTEKGYGSALREGIRAARGKYIIMADADLSYNFSDIPKFLSKLRAGDELVMGNRFLGGILPGAMPPLHRYLGNPVLSAIGRLFFGSRCGDFHCGMRGFRTESIRRLNLSTTGMEFASEMVVKATINSLAISEVPTTLAPDGRDRPPHLRSFRDGWRHLRFLLLFCPRWLFLYPGLCAMVAGVALTCVLFAGPFHSFGVILDIHTMLYAIALILIGFQAVLFFVVSRVYAMKVGLLPPSAEWESYFRLFKLEMGLACGGLMLCAGLAFSLTAVAIWGSHAFGPLEPSQTFRLVIPGVGALVLGSQIVLSSFVLSILGLKTK
jgi:glycosyltransferase involved in cell wall biosynthesis